MALTRTFSLTKPGAATVTPRGNRRECAPLARASRGPGAAARVRHGAGSPHGVTVHRGVPASTS
jgi:hypothetical protein